MFTWHVFAVLAFIAIAIVVASFLKQRKRPHERTPFERGVTFDKPQDEGAQPLPKTKRQSAQSKAPSTPQREV